MLNTIFKWLAIIANVLLYKFKRPATEIQRKDYLERDDDDDDGQDNHQFDKVDDRPWSQADSSYGEKVESQLYNYMFKTLDYGQRYAPYFPRALCFDVDEHGTVTRIKLWSENLNEDVLFFEYDQLKRVDPLLVELARNLVRLQPKERNIKLRRKLTREIYLFDKELLSNLKLRFRLAIALFTFTRGEPIVVKDPTYFYTTNFDAFLEYEFKIKI